MRKGSKEVSRRVSNSLVQFKIPFGVSNSLVSQCKVPCGVSNSLVIQCKVSCGVSNFLIVQYLYSLEVPCGVPTPSSSFAVFNRTVKISFILSYSSSC